MSKDKNIFSEKSCDFPGGITAGRIDGDWPARVGSVASYSCNEGYQLDGTSTILCSSNGRWSDGAPTCSCKYGLSILWCYGA